MLTILHGDNHIQSRAELASLMPPAHTKDVRQVDGRTISPGMLIQALESSSLFGGDTLIVIDNLFSKLGKQSKQIDSFAKIIADSCEKTDIIIWEEKELGKTVLSALGSATTKLFKTPVIIFQFLDSLRPNGVRTSLPLLMKLLAAEPAEIAYVMLVRRVRQLIQLSDTVTPAGLAPWQAARLTRQARSFTMNELLATHAKLLHMDIAIKTGASPFSLAQLLQQLIISI